MSHILVTGATGFIGQRLIAALLEEGHTIYALCRIHGTKIPSMNHPQLHLIYGDLEDTDKCLHFPNEIDVAYYLIHSMAKKVNDLESKEREVSERFVSLINQTNCKQIIYLGGIIEPNVKLSPHLTSRKNVEEVLKQAKAAITVLRASIIIGSRGASFAIIRDLVEKLPFMVAPRWVRSLCQPIAISDVIFYLKRAVLNKDLFNGTFDIGGPEVLSFKELLLRYAKYRNLRRYILDIPILTPKLSSYWLVFVTSVRFSLCSYLVESMKTNSVCQEKRIHDLIPHECLKFEKALERAFEKIDSNLIQSS